MANATFNLPSFFIGLLVGMLIMLIIIWIAWATRTAVFVNYPSSIRYCTSADYYNDPGVAIAEEGVNASDILYVQDGIMYYKRVVRGGAECAPEGNQIVRIAYPQYCSFSNGSNVTNALYKDKMFNRNQYNPVDGSSIYTNIVTDQNCIPQAGQQLTTGMPVAQWDPLHLPSTATR